MKGCLLRTFNSYTFNFNGGLCTATLAFVRGELRAREVSSFCEFRKIVYMYYCIRGNFRGGFIFTNFVNQTLRKFPLPFMSIYSNENIRKSGRVHDLLQVTLIRYKNPCNCRLGL